MRSKAIDLLTGQDMRLDSLLSELAPSPIRTNLSTQMGQLADILTADHEDVKAVRERNAAISAVHQLEHDRVIQRAPTGVPLHFATLTQSSGSEKSETPNVRVAEPEGMFIEQLNPTAPLLQLTSRARGWDGDEHEAFDLPNYKARSSARLITADGELVLAEAIESFRRGLFLSANFMLGAFSETAWMEAAKLCSSDQAVATAIGRTPPRADEVMTATLDFVAPQPTDYARRQLDPWVRASLAMRNIIGHANVLHNRTGSFTEKSTAVRLMDLYRNLDDLHVALVNKGL